MKLCLRGKSFYFIPPTSDTTQTHTLRPLPDKNPATATRAAVVAKQASKQAGRHAASRLFADNCIVRSGSDAVGQVHSINHLQCRLTFPFGFNHSVCLLFFVIYFPINNFRGVLIVMQLLVLPFFLVLCIAVRHLPPIFGATTTDESVFACSKFKAPNDKDDDATNPSPSPQVQQWQEADATLWKYVNEKVPAVLDHTGSAAFDEHLKGVQAVLRYWGAPEYLTNAGLFHSIYGTEGFQGFALPLTERRAIQDLIGEQAEKLCFVFCMVDRSTVDETVFAWKEEEVETSDNNNYTAVYKFRARPELGRFDIFLTKEEWIDFIELTLADWLEQVEGAALKPSSIFLWKVGEAYSYRRLAYRKMSRILSLERNERPSTIPTQMLEAVMATEGSATRHLVQERTPPMSDATARAYDALRANGEPIPIDFAPQPHQELLQQQQQQQSVGTEL